MNDLRQHAVRLLLDVVDRAMNPAEHADIEAWIDARSEDEGGFLWLAGLLNSRPNQLDDGLRSLLRAPARWHERIRVLVAKANADD